MTRTRRGLTSPRLTWYLTVTDKPALIGTVASDGLKDSTTGDTAMSDSLTSRGYQSLQVGPAGRKPGHPIVAASPYGALQVHGDGLGS